MNKLIIEKVFDKWSGVLYDSQQELIETWACPTEFEVLQEVNILVGCGNFNVERVFEEDYE